VLTSRNCIANGHKVKSSILSGLKIAENIDSNLAVNALVVNNHEGSKNCAWLCIGEDERGERVRASPHSITLVVFTLCLSVLITLELQGLNGSIGWPTVAGERDASMHLSQEKEHRLKRKTRVIHQR
jgi:hypothetical protein